MSISRTICRGAALWPWRDWLHRRLEGGARRERRAKPAGRTCRTRYLYHRGGPLGFVRLTERFVLASWSRTFALGKSTCRQELLASHITAASKRHACSDTTLLPHIKNMSRPFKLPEVRAAIRSEGYGRVLADDRFQSISMIPFFP